MAARSLERAMSARSLTIRRNFVSSISSNRASLSAATRRAKGLPLPRALPLANRPLASRPALMFSLNSRGVAASAGSSDLLCEWVLRFAVVVLMDALLDLGGGQLACGLDDGPLAVQPLRLDRVQPRRLDRQPAHPDLAPTLALGPP